MIMLLLGLLVFLGVHSLRIGAEDWRGAQVVRLGEKRWKGLISLLALLGLVLVVFGYGETRAAADLWSPPSWTRHLGALLTLPAFVLLAAAYVPGNRVKALVGHPMALSVVLWAFAHLVSNGRLGDVLLFGAFLVWSMLSFVAARRRDRRAGTTYARGPATRDALTLGVGVAAWLLFARWGHVWLTGVAPFG